MEMIIKCTPFLVTKRVMHTNPFITVYKHAYLLINQNMCGKPTQHEYCDKHLYPTQNHRALEILTIFNYLILCKSLNSKTVV